VDQETHEQLRYAQSLLGHAVPSGDVAQVLKRALDALVRELEQKKFARNARSRPRRGTADPRHVPAQVRSTVWQRDGGQCTFVSQNGRRCESRTRLEFDHIEPLARGGRTIASNLRLRCRAHNQYEAERTFGSGFMRAKRGEARQRAEEASANARTRTTSRSRARSEAAAAAPAADVIPWLRRLGFSADDARRGAERCAHLDDAPLEQRVRMALQTLAPPCRHEPAPQASATP